MVVLKVQLRVAPKLVYFDRCGCTYDSTASSSWVGTTTASKYVEPSKHCLGCVGTGHHIKMVWPGSTR